MSFEINALDKNFYPHNAFLNLFTHSMSENDEKTDF